MAKRTPPKKKTQQPKTPRRRSIHFAVRTNPRHDPNDTQSVDVGPPLVAFEEPALHRGRRKCAASILNGMEVKHGVTKLETGTIRDVFIRTLRRPFWKVLHQSTSFVSYFWRSTNCAQALQRGNDFVSSINNRMEEIPRSNGMGVIRGVTNLETGTARDIIIRRITRPFWEECINVIKTPDMRYRVCVVGSPGIGKTISALTAQQATEIAQGRMDVVGSFATNQPRSAIIGYAKIQQDGESSFWPRNMEIISPSVAEKVSAKFMANLWGLMLQDDEVGWKIFDAYCRQLMAAPPARSFRCRPCCGQRDDAYNHERDFVLGGCDKVRMRLNIISSAVFEGDCSMTLFHSMDPRHKLFDFIYKDIDGTFHAFQVTLGKKHLVNVSHIQKLRGKLGNSHLALYYLIPADRFNSFVTTPTNPMTDGLTSVWHVLIPNPNTEYNSSLLHQSLL